MKMTKTTYGGEKEILKYSGHFVAVPVMVDSTSVMAENGKKVLKGGTIIGGKSASALTNREEAVTAKNSLEAEGVLLWDVDVTEGDAPGSMVIHGFVSLDKLPAAPEPDAVLALKQITFIN